MYYGLRSNKIHNWLRTKKTRNLYFGLLFVLISVIVFWIFFLYQPLECLINLEQQRVISLREQFINCELACKEYAKLEQKIKEQQQIIADSVHNEKNIECDYLNVLLQHEQQAGLTLDMCSRDYSNEDEGLIPCDLSCKLHGTLNQLVTFFELLSQSNAYLGCNKLSLNYENNEQFDINACFNYFIPSS